MGPRGRGGAHGLPQGCQQDARGERRVRRRPGAHAGAHLGALRRPGRGARHHRRPAPGDQRPHRGLVHDRRRVPRARARSGGLRLLRAGPGRRAPLRVDRRPGDHVRDGLARLTRRDRRVGATAGRGRPACPRPAGARRPGPPGRGLRRRRGRAPGGAAGGAPGLARAPAGRPAGVAGHGRDAAADRRASQRGLPAQPRGRRARGARARAGHRARRRHAPPALLLLPFRPGARVPGRADPARRRRPHHTRDRRRLLRPRGDDGAADQPCQAHPPRAPARPARRPRRRAARALSRLHGRPRGPGGPGRRGDPARPPAHPRHGGARGARAARADAPQPCPDAGAARRGGPDRHARPPGPRPVGHARDRRGRARPAVGARHADRRTAPGPLPGRGRDRGPARRRGECRGDRLAADPRLVRRARWADRGPRAPGPRRGARARGRGRPCARCRRRAARDGPAA